MSKELERAKVEYATRILEDQHALQRDSFYEFVKYYWEVEKKTKLDDNRHIQEICIQLEEVYHGRLKRLMINIPPRSLKTELASIAFPARCLGKKSETQFMGVSYSASLAQDASRTCRDMYVSKTYRMIFPRAAALLKDQDTKQFRKNKKGGHYYATGSSGTIIGKGCDIMIIDDPLKPDDAMSETTRPAINKNYHGTLSSRFNDPANGAIIIIMQRLHDDDLCGHLLDQESKGGDVWKKLVVQAIPDEDTKNTKAGKSFFPKRFPLDLLKAKKRKDKMVFSCQYQQQPVNKDTQEFHEERFKYHGSNNIEGEFPTPKGLRIFTTVDPAFKQKQENDNSCIMTAGFDGDKMYILEYSVGKRSADVLQDKILYHIQKRRPEKTGIEAYQAQSMIVTFLKKRLSEMNIHTTVEELTQAGDKFTKIRRLVVLYRDGLIFHRAEMLELENELKRFPRGKHDDMIDAEQMLYSLYELQPNSTNTYDMNFERDKNGVPIQQEFYPEKRL